MRAEFRELAGVFLVVLGLVVAATLASALAWSGVGLIAFVPLVGLAVFPLQIAALLLRGLVFEYLGLTALGAYVHLYIAAPRVRTASTVTPAAVDCVIGPHGNIRHDTTTTCSRARRRPMQESAIRRMGTLGLRVTGPHLVRARLSRRRTSSRGRSFATSPRRCSTAGIRRVLQYGPTRGYRPLVEAIVEILARARHPRRARRSDRHDRIAAGARPDGARVRSIPGDVVLVELPTYTGAITAFRNVAGAAGRRRSRTPTGSTSTISTGSPRASARQGRRIAFLYVVPNFQNPDRPADRAREAARGCSSGRRGGSVLIVEDDPYGALYFEDVATAAETRPIKADDAEGRVVYLSSFSKTLAPGFRVAWIDAPAPIVAKLEVAKQAADLCTGALDQRIVYEAWKRGVLDGAPAACCGRSTRTSDASWKRRCGASSAT